MRADPWGATAADSEMRTPLHYAALAGDAAAVQVVFDLKPERVAPGMLIQQQDATKMTVLHSAVLSGNEELVLLLLRLGQGAALNMRSTSGFFPSHLACSKGMSRAVQVMCELEQGTIQEPKKSNVGGLSCDYMGSSDPDGASLLHRATVEGHDDVVKVLLSSGLCDPNLQDADGSTALHLACAMGLDEIIEMLLPATDIDLLDAQGKRAMEWRHELCNVSSELTGALVLVDITVTVSGRSLLTIRTL